MEMEKLKITLAALQQDVKEIATQQKEILRLTQQVTALQTQVTDLNDKLKAKDETIKKLEIRLDDAEQYSRIDDVIISGLKTRHQSYAKAAAANSTDEPTLTETETLESQVIQFFASKDIHIDSHQISACHALPQKSSDDPLNPAQRRAKFPPAIIIRFVNRKQKVQLLQQYKKLKDTGVYVNEHLTKKNGDIAKQARTLRNDKKIKATWIRNCKVFIRTNGATPEEEKVVLVKEMSDLDKY